MTLYVITSKASTPTRQSNGPLRLNNNWPLAHRDLRAYYPLAGNANDISPYKRHLTRSNGRFQTSGTTPSAALEVHKNLLFDMDGTGDYLQSQVDEDWGLSDHDEITISYWAYFDGDPSANEFHCGFVDHDAGERYVGCVANYSGGAGQLSAFHLDESASVGSEYADYTGLTDGFFWRHIVSTSRSSDGGQTKLYVNGTLQATGTAKTGDNATRTGARFNIGRDEGDTSRDCQGQIHNVGVWFSELSQEEVSYLWRRQTRFSVYETVLNRRHFLPSTAGSAPVAHHYYQTIRAS